MKFSNNRLLVVLLHLMVWFMLFGLPYLLVSGQEPLLAKIMEHSWIPLVTYAFVFYSNYLVLVERFLFNRKVTWFVVINVLLLIAVVYGITEIRSWFFVHDPVGPENRIRIRPPKTLFIYIEVLSSLVPLFFAIALRILGRWIKTRADQQEAAAFKLESELQHLRYQLQPHFFFNSLNNIYSLVDSSPERAKETIHALGKLMRYLLYDTNTATVSLSKEIVFMRKYIELMEIRTSDRTRIFVSFPEIKDDILIAPLLFISLIENAFKHGISATGESALFFDMQVSGSKVRFVSRNPDLPKTTADKSGSGIGLHNLEQRLDLLYPGRYSFRSHVSNGQFVSELEIELKPEV